MTTYFVNTGPAIITLALTGASAPPKWIGWGVGGTGGVGSTGLATPKDVDLSGAGPGRTVGAMTQQTTTLNNDTYQVTGTRTMTATGPVTVTELGLFDALTAGNLCILADSQSVALSVGDSIATTWKMKFA